MTLKKVVQDSSGIVGLFNVEQAAQNIYLAMHAIQQRGQDGVGLAISDGENVVCKKGFGLLSENLKQDTLNSLEGNIAIGQLRMATKNDSQLENVQPIMVRSHQRYFAVVSSGMITNAISLRTKLENDPSVEDPIDKYELYEIIRTINDPEHPLTLEQINVVSVDNIHVDNEKKRITVYFTPTIPNLTNCIKLFFIFHHFTVNTHVGIHSSQLA